jgi:hypothetical protein
MQFRPLCTPELSVKGNASEGEAHPVRCKRWSCPVCAQINRARVIAIARKACPRAMLTLTVSSTAYPDVDQAAEALKRGLRLLRLGLARHARIENFEFLAVFEKHKSGHPHLHLLIRGKYIPWQYLKRRWKELTGSSQIFINKIATTGQAAFYAAKYIGKDLHAFAHCKRWWRSHGYSEGVTDDYQPSQRYGPPTRYLASVHNLFHVLRYEGFTLERHGRDGIRWHAPPDWPLPLDALLAFSEGQTRAVARARVARAGASS